MASFSLLDANPISVHKRTQPHTSTHTHTHTHTHTRHRHSVQNTDRNDLLPWWSSVKQLQGQMLGWTAPLPSLPHSLMHAHAQDLISPVTSALIINYGRHFTSLFLVLSSSFAACKAFLFLSCIRCPQWQKEANRERERDGAVYRSQVRWETW